MLKQKINRGFTIIEILVVIVIIIIFVFIAWPNITNWATDREVKKNVYEWVEYLEGKKIEVNNGKYPVVWIRMGSGASVSNNFYYMTHDEWARQKALGKKGIFGGRGCPSSPRVPNQNWTKGTDYFNQNKWDGIVRFHPRNNTCFSTEGIIGNSAEFNSSISSLKTLKWIFCSAKNTTKSGPNRCSMNMRTKHDHRYAVFIDRGYNITVYKYLVKKDKWKLQ